MGRVRVGCVGVRVGRVLGVRVWGVLGCVLGVCGGVVGACVWGGGGVAERKYRSPLYYPDTLVNPDTCLGIINKPFY